ncbi:hypothetical protein P7K49_006153 [Saguinus oedipus]|uniref:Uncharacterized protein n=1 Tax=Saguinus oedipus TaxID=9490 RepID=A0ABQ9W1K9_SAGOE|nr:hypothetical protein P7K49_006153 [Saguinus oedipus]
MANCEFRPVSGDKPCCRLSRKAQLCLGVGLLVLTLVVVVAPAVPALAVGRAGHYRPLSRDRPGAMRAPVGTAGTAVPRARGSLRDLLESGIYRCGSAQRPPGDAKSGEQLALAPSVPAEGPSPSQGRSPLSARSAPLHRFGDTK